MSNVVLGAILLGAILLVAPVTGCGRQDILPQPVVSPAKVMLTAGTPAADFTGHDIDGNAITLSDHLSKEVVLLNFSASWCAPCLEEFPHLRRMFAANRARGLFVVSVSMDGPESVANVPAFARRNQLNFPMVIDDNSQIAALYNPTKAAPLTILIDRRGKIAYVREGYVVGDEITLAAEVEKALGAPTPP